jgi:hypothetical protein
MSSNNDLENYVAGELMKEWFPKRYDDPSWLETEDAQNWVEISYADAKAAVRAVLDWQNKISNSGE